MTRRWKPIERAAVLLMEDVDHLAREVMARFQDEIPGYRDIDEGPLLDDIRENVTRAIAGLAGRRGPTDAEIVEASHVIEARAQQGLEIEGVLTAYRIGAETLRRELRKRAKRVEAPDSTTFEALECLWNWTDSMTAHAVRAHRQADLRMARRDQAQRTSFLRAALNGSLSPAELGREAALLGLSLERSYVPFRIRASGSMDDVERAITQASMGAARSDRTPSLWGLIDGDLAGFGLQAPRLDGDVCVGVGPSADLAGIWPSYLLATRALEAAWRFGMRGAFRLEDVPLHAAIVADEEVGARLVERFLDPLADDARSGDVLGRSVGAFLDHGLRIEETARALFIHPNTLRHRLRRFEQVTGCDLRTVEDLFAVWWALRRGEAAGRSRPVS